MDTGIIGIIISIIGIAVSLILALFASKSKRPIFQHEYENIITHNFKLVDIKILYRDIEIDSISKSTFCIWNKGRKTIRKNDLLEDDPFGLRNDCRILKFNYITTNSMNKTFMIKYDNELKIYRFLFDAMKKNEGVLIEILHTGKNNQISIVGDIDDAAKIINIYGLYKRRLIISLSLLFAIYVTLIALYICGSFGFEGGFLGIGLGNGKGPIINRFISEIGFLGLITIPMFVFIPVYTVLNKLALKVPKVFTELKKQYNKKVEVDIENLD